ncbi:adenylyltransferase/cytidyltransferase family protein [Pseudoalteromonas sp. T1lg10]|uniref:adenylyltransferase/cytidyltransferase family protein n=1 Tax=Pseudoalteromonas sp. T1lg10 TaxID=2077093 RepID=UPI000CF62B47|nr:adenylyltransferase/cytidyltransferase family protein [Pseudoalteromonas sp. T1lg10]
MTIKVITFGTFDVFHVGHVNLLQRAAKLGDELIVGVSSDPLNRQKKGRAPVYSQQDRLRIIAAMSDVTRVFVEDCLTLKRRYIKEHGADILVMGDDWRGKFDEFNDICEVIYLPRTPSISTTEIIEVVRQPEFC